MRKIPTIYLRNPDDRRFVTDVVTPGCEWVLAGDGTATRKYDGTCFMLDADGAWWARREVKPGKQPPPRFRESEHDDATGKTVGWEPAEQSPFAKFWREARPGLLGTEPGTFELCGPKINGNPEGFYAHRLIRHACAEQLRLPPGPPPQGYVDAARAAGWEGIVWHHPDGRMAKLKVRDYLGEGTAP